MGKAFAALGLLALGLLTAPALTGSAASQDGLQLDLEHHIIGWDGVGWPFPQHEPGKGSTSGPDQVDFAIEAPPVHGLYPGAVKPMNLRVVNTGRYDLKIIDLSGTVVRTSKPGCAPTPLNLTVRQHRTVAFTVPAHERRDAGSLSLYMPNTVVNACQGATFTVQLRGTGTEVHR